MLTLRAALIGSVFLAITSLPAKAENPEADGLRRTQQTETRNLRALDDAKADTPNAGLTSKVLIEGSENEGLATVRISNYFGASASNVYRWSLGASAPFSDDDDERQIGDLSGLSAESTATLDIGWVKIDSIEARAARKNKKPNDISNARLDEACNPYAKEIFGVELNKVHEKINEKQELNCTDAIFSRAIFERSPSVLALLERAKTDQAAQYQLDKLEEARKNYLGHYWAILGPPAPLWTAGLQLKASKTNFTYVLDSDLTQELEASKTSGSIGVYINRVYERQLVGVAYERVTNYEPGRTAQLCMPLGTTGSLECSEKVVGKPTKATPDIISVEWRYLIFPRALAISPIIAYDLDEHEWSARVPVYGAANKDGDLVGGLSVNWDSKEDEVTAVVFFGKKFTFFE